MAYEPETLTLDYLRSLPVPSFIERDPFALKRLYVAKFEERTGRKLYPAQTEMFVIETMAYAKSVFGEAVQTSFMQNRAIWAQGGHLDELGSNVSTFRLKAQTANCRVAFTLSGARPVGVTVPAGTRVSAGTEQVFNTVAELIIAAGETVGEADVVALEPGAAHNGFLPGQIDTILDPVAWVATVANTIESAGGADIEDDDRFRSRVVNAFERISKAGPKKGYQENVKAVNPSIVAVEVVKPQAGYIEITPLMEEDGVGAVSAQAIDDAILAFLDPDTIAPMGDYVSIVKAVPVDFDIDLTVRVHGDGTGMAEKVEAAARAAFRPWSLSLGAQVAPTEIIAAVKALSGVIDVDGPGFPFTDLTAIQFARLDQLSVDIVDAPNV